MCKWSVTAVTSQGPEFDTSFTAHMQGHEGEAKHTGLHSLDGADSSVVQIVNDKR